MCGGDHVRIQVHPLDVAVLSGPLVQCVREFSRSTPHIKNGSDRTLLPIHQVEQRRPILPHETVLCAVPNNVPLVIIVRARKRVSESERGTVQSDEPHRCCHHCHRCRTVCVAPSSMACSDTAEAGSRDAGVAGVVVGFIVDTADKEKLATVVRLYGGARRATMGTTMMERMGSNKNQSNRLFEWAGFLQTAVCFCESRPSKTPNVRFLHRGCSRASKNSKFEFFTSSSSSSRHEWRHRLSTAWKRTLSDTVGNYPPLLQLHLSNSNDGGIPTCSPVHTRPTI